MNETQEPSTAMPPLPDGEYAVVEVLGHRTYVGRVEEVERFGSKLMSIEPIFQGALLPAVLVGGGSLYQFTPCTKERAIARAPTSEWQLPTSVRAVMPVALLSAPESEEEGDEPTFAPRFLDEED